MKTPICDCGSDQLRYLGISDVEGNTVIEVFRCEECGGAVERRTVVNPIDDDELAGEVVNDSDADYDSWFPLT